MKLQNIKNNSLKLLTLGLGILLSGSLTLQASPAAFLDVSCSLTSARTANPEVRSASIPLQRGDLTLNQASANFNFGQGDSIVFTLQYVITDAADGDRSDQVLQVSQELKIKGPDGVTVAQGGYDAYIKRTDGSGSSISAANQARNGLFSTCSTMVRASRDR